MSLDKKAFSKYKFLNHINRIRDLVNGKNVFPIQVEIDPASFCNFNCTYCRSPNGFEKKLMLTNAFCSGLFRELADGGVKSITVSGGGEPTINPEIAQILRSSSAVGLSTALITNGSMLYMDELRNAILDSCCGVRVSLNAVDRGKHDKLCRPSQKGVFDRIISSISTLVGEKNRFGKNLLIGLQFIFDSDNFKDIFASAKLSKDLGADYVELRQIQFEDILHRKIKTAKEISSKISCLIDEAKRKFEDQNFHVLKRMQNPVLLTGNFDCDSEFCIASRLAATIGADRHVYACGGLRYIPKYSFGKIDGSFREIWNGKKRKQVLKKLKFKNCAKYCGYKPYVILNEAIDYLSSNRPHGGFL